MATVTGSTTTIQFLDAGDIMKILGCKKTKAYKIIQGLNSELEEQGYLIRRGWISTEYFRKRYYGVQIIKSNNGNKKTG